MNVTPSLHTSTYASQVNRMVLYRRVAWRLLPFVGLCYIAAFLDRVNIGYAKLTMMADLQLSEVAYGLGAGLFFVGYFFFEVPSNMLMHKIGAKATISRIMILWGLISASFSFVQTEWQFYLLRFLLGVAEAGFYPGILLYLTYWFPASWRAKAVGLFVCAIPLAGVLGGPLSGWILESWDQVYGLAGWQWLFVLEAVPSVILGVAVWFVMDDRPRGARWLKPEERDAIEFDLSQDEIKKGDGTSHSLRAAFSNKWIRLLTLIIICQALGIYALSFWLPTLIQQAGVTGMLNIGLISAIPNVLAVISIILVGRSSDRLRERRWHLIVPFAAGGLGLFVSGLFSGNTLIALGALCIATMGSYTATALAWNLPPAFTTSVGVAGTIALLNSIGALSGFISPFFLGWTTQTFGTPHLAIYTLAGFMVLGAALTFLVPARRVNI